MTPQEQTIHVATKMYAVQAIAQSLVWCAFVMRSRNDLNRALDVAADVVVDVSQGDVVVEPPLHEDLQLELIKSLEEQLQLPTEPDWARIQVLARRWLELLRGECAGIPDADATMVSLIEGLG